MPELPEVETIRRDLDAEIVGRRIDDVTIEGARTVRRHEPGLIASSIKGHTVKATRRKGKFLLLDLDGEITLAAHLRMSGQLLWTKDFNIPVEKHTHARIRFAEKKPEADSTQGIPTRFAPELRFVDPRTFGELWVTTPDVPELAHLGPDALNELDDWTVLRDAIGNRRSPLKVVLLNQEVVAGIGNIYGDEILWEAKLRGDKPAGELSTHAIKRLHDATGRVMAQAVKSRGSTLRDARYVDLYGLAGEAQRAHNAYDREGEPCPRCGRPIRRITLGGRSAYFCPTCQR